MDPIEVRSLHFYKTAEAMDLARGGNGLDFDWEKATYERLTEGKGLLSFGEINHLAYLQSRIVVEADGVDAWLAPTRLRKQIPTR